MTAKHPSQFPENNEQSMPFILSEFVRRHHLISNRDADPTPVSLLIRKTSQSTGATKCVECWGERDQGSVRPDCTSCYGVGYEGGYEKTTARVRVLQANRLISLEEMGLVLNYQPEAWIAGATPIVADGDVVVRANNFRYEVMDYTPQETQGVITRQVFRLKFLPPKEFPGVYRFPA